MIKKKDISKEDIDTWENYIKYPTDVFDKDQNNISNNTNNNKKRFRYDLHGYTLLAANKKVKELIPFCVKKKYQEILLITGKGIHSNIEKDVYSSRDLSKLKFSVPEFINSDQDLSKHIISINNANSSEGGDGAIIIRLKSL